MLYNKQSWSCKGCGISCKQVDSGSENGSSSLTTNVLGMAFTYAVNQNSFSKLCCFVFKDQCLLLTLPSLDLKCSLGSMINVNKEKIL